MLCYRDMTFCSFHEGCKGAPECGRALTDEVAAMADSFGAPICQFASHPECWDPKDQPDPPTLKERK